MTKTVDEIMEQVGAILMAYMDDGTSVTECISLKAKLRAMIEDVVRVADGLVEWANELVIPKDRASLGYNFARSEVKKMLENLKVVSNE